MNRWQDFLRAEEVCRKVWKRLKDSFEGEIGDFLKRAYLVISYGPYRKQMPFNSNSARSIAKEYPGFFIKDADGEKFTALAKKIRQAELNKQTPDKKDVGGFEGFDINNLRIVPFQFEVRFPTVNIEFIQKIKQSKYCDKERTEMSRMSINVVLKNEI